MANPITDSVQARALHLLELIRDATEASGTPVFVDQFTTETGWDAGQLQAAFRYLTSKRWVDTFSIPFTGRINAFGQDELAKHPSPAVSSLPTPATAHEWDAFLSHANEDKAEVAIPLARALKERGIRVWLDEFTLTVGDSLSRSIDAGLSASRFGIVVLSPAFFAKEWPRRELDGLVAREVGGQKIILPVWHRLSKDSILRFSPTLADRIATHSDKGIDAVADELALAIQKGGHKLTPPGSTQLQTRTELFSGAPHSDAAKGDEFHQRRAAAIVAGKSPVKLMDQALLILHIFPNEALSGRSSAKFEAMSNDPRSFLPMGSKMLQESWIVTDGLVVGSNRNGSQMEQRAYSFVFRSGAVETVASSILQGDENFLPLPKLQTLIADQALRISKGLNTLGLAPPYYVYVTLAGLGGTRLLQQWPDGALPEDMPFGELGSGLLNFDVAILEHLPKDRSDCFVMLRPLFIHLANAAGLSTPPPLI